MIILGDQHQQHAEAGIYLTYCDRHEPPPERFCWLCFPKCPVCQAEKQRQAERAKERNAQTELLGMEES